MRWQQRSGRIRGRPCGVAGFDGERGDVGDDFGAGFEDDQEDADGACDAGQDQVVVQQCRCRGFVDGVLEHDDVEDALEHVFIFPWLAQIQSLY
jgi:hypothetical protein